MSNENKKNFLSNAIFNSKIASQNTTAKEKWLGYFLGPAGALFLNALLAQGFLNVFYTDELGMAPIWGGLFLVIFPVISKIIDAGTNIIMGYIIDRTRTVQGKARPWILCSIPLLAISGVLLYLVPTRANVTVKVIWIIFTYNLYYSFSFTMYNVSHMLMVPLSTRNDSQRSGLAVFTNVANIAITGILVALLFPMLVLPKIKGNIDAWITVMSIAAIISLPIMFLEYFYTKERVTLENEHIEKPLNISIKAQLSVCVKSKNWWILVTFWLVYWIGQLIRSNSITYYSNWILGSTYADGITQTLLNAIGGLPMGIGVFLVWPITKRFGKTATSAVGLALCAVGDIICFIFPKNLYVVLVGQFIMNMGLVPAAYVFPALMASVFDELEWKCGHRCDGSASSVINAMNTIAVGLSIAIFNLLIRGYVQPVFDSSGELISTQSDKVLNAIVWAFTGINIFTHSLLAILLIFLDVEKKLPKIQKEIMERYKAECLANGEEWIEPDERNRLLQEKLDAKAEEIFFNELKEKCRKNPKLNFEDLLEKHKLKIAKQKQKQQQKDIKRREDDATFALKMQERVDRKAKNREDKRK